MSDIKWIQTFSGVQFDLEHPKESDIYIEDIAHALSQLCRFNGHTRVFYSVAQHSYYVARYLEHKGFDNKTVLAGLLHDGAEAYTGDIVKPVKKLISGFSALEERIQSIIYKRFGVDFNDDVSSAVSYVDGLLLFAEKNIFMRDHIVWPGEHNLPMAFKLEHWMGDIAEARFLGFFETLYGGQNAEQKTD